MTDSQSPRPPRRTAAQLRRAECWVFDLDNTLYPANNQVFAQVDRRMRQFIAGYLDLAEDEAHRLQKQYFRDYGTTLRGLMKRHGLDPQPYLDFVHDIDLASIETDPDLDAALAALDGRKLIYTNASTRHAERILARIGVAHHFETVFDIVDAGYTPKPEPQPYREMARRLGVDPRGAVMVEDIARNLKPAADLGMATVWVRTETQWGRGEPDGDYVDHETEDLVSWLAAVSRAG